MTRETLKRAEELHRQLGYVNEALSFFIYYGKTCDIGTSDGKKEIRTSWLDDTNHIANDIKELLKNRAREIELEIEKL